MNCPLNWFLLQSGLGDPAGNMACDEAMLESAAASGRSSLRLYGWTVPAATFGYFQNYSVVSALTALRPLIRRPTGGGLVLHDADWTYSVCIPPSDPWYEHRAVDSYRRIHEWVQAAFARLRVSTELAPQRVAEAVGQCFVGAEQFDHLCNGQKVAGAAQRRRKDGLLIQGSIQASTLGIARRDFEGALCDVARENWGIGWVEFPETEPFRTRCRDLRDAKYARDEYNRARLA